MIVNKFTIGVGWLKRRSDEISSDYNNFDPRWIAKRLRAGDRFTAPARPTGNTTLFDQPPAGCAADGEGAAAHDAADSRDE
jgi:hypothetical protein